MSLLNSPDYRLMCELAGARYLGTCDHVVIFQDPQDDFVMKLYAFALRSPEDVKAALKNHREPVVGFEPLEKQEAL
jgi:hypothetical protein